MLCIHMNKKWQEFNLIIFYLLLYIGLFQSVMIYFLYIFSSLKYAKTVRVYYKWICYGCCYSDMQFLYLVFNKGTKKDAKRQKKKKKKNKHHIWHFVTSKLWLHCETINVVLKMTFPFCAFCCEIFKICCKISVCFVFFLFRICFCKGFTHGTLPILMISVFFLFPRLLVS